MLLKLDGPISLMSGHPQMRTLAVEGRELSSVSEARPIVSPIGTG